ncbi:outer membrane protein assembly factor BamB family protein [Halorubellus salinus]|uniref:outer membrane protein assembly factor BamB family protein n=1 Tax=Halorubellus salinus TaxID=755309 RepID=UPI001D07AADE|nr:PQQ-binding-like beta-propeller repeat protein [Halorubellus salinus]
MGHADDERRGIDRRLLLRALGAGAFAGASGHAAGSGERAGHGASKRHRERGRSRCVVDDFQDGDLDEYVARDGPKANWRVASFRNGRVLEFQGGDGADLQSYSGLGTYPRRGDRFSFLFYPYGNWDGYAMFSFAIADSENFQRRYELEFEPAESEVRLQYSRAPGDEETIASASRSFDGRDRQIVEVDWAASSDDIVATVTDSDDDGTTLRASEPDDAPTGGGIGFYGSGDAAWLFDYVTILDCDDRSDGDDGDDDARYVTVVDDFLDGDLDEYVAADGPKSNWSIVDFSAYDGRRALQFQGGDGADIQSHRGLPAYPQRGDRIRLDFGTLGNWDGYAMFSFGIADPDNFQRRYELEFEPAESEVRLQYSRAPGDEETIASASADLRRDGFYEVTVDWAASSDDIVVTVQDLVTTVATLRAPEPDGAPTQGGIGFYGSGDAAWAFDSVRLSRDDGDTGGDDDGHDAGMIVDDFEDDDLTEYVAADGPKANWSVVGDHVNHGRHALQFQGGEGTDLQSHRGLPAYPKRGDRFKLMFGTFGNWNGYAMFSFAIADPDDFQRRYELEFEPAADEVRLQYSRAPDDEETIASANVDLQQDWFYLVTVDWAASSDDIVVSIGTQNPWVELRAPEPDGAPTEGGIGFYGSGDAAWVFDDVRILDRTGSGDDGDDAGSDDDWPTVQYDFANTGWARTESGPAGGVTETWSTAVSFEEANEPAVVDGSVYTTGSGSAHGLYSLNAADGSVEWLYRIDDGSRSPASVVDGTVYVGGNDLHAHAVDANDGGRVWRTELIDSCTVAPAVARGAAFFGNLYGDVAMLNASTGDELGNAAVGMIVTADPAVVDGVLYAASPAGVLGAYDVGPAYDVALSTSRWTRFDDVEGGITAPTVDDDTVYAAFYNGDAADSRLYALDRTDGSERWRFDVDLQASPAVTDDSVYLLSDDGVMYALDRSDGSVRWRTATSESTNAAPTVADGVVYAGTDSLHAFDAEAGAERWTYDTDYAVVGAPAVVDDVVYVGGTDGLVHALVAR